MIVRILIMTLLIILSLSCSRNIYQFQSVNNNETIELKKGNKFNFTFEDKTENLKFNVQGDYLLGDSNTIQFTFDPVEIGNLKFLPINEADVKLEQLSKEQNQFVYHLEILESLLKEAVWGINVSALSEGEQIFYKQTNRKGKVTFKSLNPIDTFVLQCENCVPTIITLKDSNSYLINVIWEQVKARYERGHMIPDRGPIKIMNVQIKNGKITHIIQNDLSNKKFVKK